MNVGRMMTIGRRHTATWLIRVSIVLAILAWVPAALGVDPPVEGVTGDPALTVAPAVADTTVADPTVVSPPPPVVDAAPVAQDPAALPPPPPAEPVVALDVTPAPVPSVVAAASEPAQSVVTESTPAAPQEIFIVVQDTPVVTPAPEAAAPAPVGFESGAPPLTTDQIGPDTGATAVVAQSSTLLAQKADAGRPVMAPLIVPMVQTLGSGLLSAYERRQAFGSGLASGQMVRRGETAGPTPTTTHERSRATPALADMPFGFVAPPGGWSGQGAGILALLMGFLPLGVPDGKSSLTLETQAALLLIGGLLMIIPFFAFPLRDRRRRGPGGFATLALRPG